MEPCDWLKDGRGEGSPVVWAWATWRTPRPHPVGAWWFRGPPPQRLAPSPRDQTPPPPPFPLPHLRSIEWERADWRIQFYWGWGRGATRGGLLGGGIWGRCWGPFGMGSPPFRGAPSRTEAEAQGRWDVGDTADFGPELAWLLSGVWHSRKRCRRAVMKMKICIRASGSPRHIRLPAEPPPCQQLVGGPQTHRGSQSHTWGVAKSHSGSQPHLQRRA